MLPFLLLFFFKFGLDILKPKKCSEGTVDKMVEFENQLWYLEIPKMLKIGVSDVW